MFSAVIADEGVELLVAHLFLKPLPFYTPFSRITGFLRFLRLLSNYDWAFSPLVIDIIGDLTSNDEKEMTENFMLSRKSYEENAQSLEPAIFLATSYDKSSQSWTRPSPNSYELKRMVAYARSSADFLTKLILHDQIDNHKWERLFRTPLNNYDAVILLQRDRLASPQRLLFPSEMSQGKHVVQGNASTVFYPFLSLGDVQGNVHALKKKLMVNFDPVRCYVEDIKGQFDDTLNLWYDSGRRCDWSYMGETEFKEANTRKNPRGKSRSN